MTRGAAKSPEARRGGFTLAELIVVLALLGMLLGVAAPAFTGGRIEEDGAAVVMRALAAARNTALQQGSLTEAVVDPSSARIWVRSHDARPRLDTTYVLPLPVGTTLSAPTLRVRYAFRADGSGWGDSLVVRSAGDGVWITVEPLTGVARRSDGVGDAFPRAAR